MLHCACRQHGQPPKLVTSRASDSFCHPAAFSARCLRGSAQPQCALTTSAVTYVGLSTVPAALSRAQAQCLTEWYDSFAKPMGAEPSASQVHCALSHSALEGLSSVSSCAQAVAKACTLKRHCGTRSVATVQSDIDEKIADIGGLHIALRAIQSMREREHSTRLNPCAPQVHWSIHAERNTLVTACYIDGWVLATAAVRMHSAVGPREQWHMRVTHNTIAVCGIGLHCWTSAG